MSTKQPKYQQIADWLRQQVQQELFPGDKIPSEHQLADQFSVSRQTVRHAVSLLEQENLLQSVRGSGTFVTQPQKSPAKPTKTIGVISTYLDNYIFPSIIRGIEEVLTGRGYQMQLFLTHNQVEHETRALKTILEHPVDGLIIEPTKSGLPNPNAGYYQRLRRQNIPYVFFHASYPENTAPLIALDDTKVGQVATEHLLSMGHTRIGGVFLSDDRQGHLRYAGYTQALQQAGQPLRSADVLWFTTEDMPLLAKETPRLEQLLTKVTAVVCYNDQTALDVLAVTKRLGRSVPEDISLVGVDNSSLAQLGEVPLTSVEHPSQDMGRTAASQLLALLNGNEAKGKIYQPKLVSRASVQDIR